MSSRQERDQRRTIYCSSENTLKSWEVQLERSRNCDIPIIPQEKFYIPEEAPIVEVATLVPDGIIIFSQERVFTCTETFGDAIGDDVTIPYGQYFSNISYLSIPNITDIQLNNISKKNQANINYELSRENFSVLLQLGLTRTQREFLEEEVLASINSLKSIVFQAGIGSLRCTFYSDEQIYGCPANSYLNGIYNSNVLIYRVGYRKSEISKANANEKVRLLALSELENCLYGNDPVTERCPDGFYVGPIQTDTPDAPSEGGVFFVQGNLFFEKEKEMADLKASILAKDSLICVYCNDEFDTAGCEGLTEEGKVGNVIKVKAGTICRNTKEELDAAIIEYNNNADPCLYSNFTITCECFDLEGYTAELFNTNSATINAGEFIAESQAEANGLALEACLEQLIDICYKEGEPPTDDDGGGGGGDGPICEDDCSCMNLEQAEESFGKDGYEFCLSEGQTLVNNRPPACKVEENYGTKNNVKGGEKKPFTENREPYIFYYCTKAKEDDDDGDGDPNDNVCPSGCECVDNWEEALKNLDPKYEYIGCSGSDGGVATAFCENQNKVSTCHKLVPKERECCDEGDPDPDPDPGPDPTSYGTGSIVITDCDDQPTTLLEWEDGNVTTNENITFSACGGLPDGVEGDILYHDGYQWVTLNRPASYVTHVLAISGVTPYWLATEDCDETNTPEP